MKKNRLKSLRVFAGNLQGEELSQKDVCETLELCPKTWSAYELGTRKIPGDVLRHFCEFYGIIYTKNMLETDEEFKHVEHEKFLDGPGTGQFLRLTKPDGTIIAVNRDHIITAEFDIKEKLSILKLVNKEELRVTEISGVIFEALGVKYE